MRIGRFNLRLFFFLGPSSASLINLKNVIDQWINLLRNIFKTMRLTNLGKNLFIVILTHKTVILYLGETVFYCFVQSLVRFDFFIFPNWHGDDFNLVRGRYWLLYNFTANGISAFIFMLARIVIKGLGWFDFVGFTRPSNFSFQIVWQFTFRRASHGRCHTSKLLALLLQGLRVWVWNQMIAWMITEFACCLLGKLAKLGWLMSGF